jgi:protein arginine kinase activator
MQCDSCRDQEATVYLKQVVDGDSRELKLCEACARKHGLSVPTALSISELLFGPDAGVVKASKPDKTCPNCHMRRSDFQKTSRFGCGECYTTFGDDLRDILPDLQRGFQHVGKVPVSEQALVEMATLQRQLDAAIAAQDFELAATLRDQIKALKDPRDPVVREGIAP